MTSNFFKPLFHETEQTEQRTFCKFFFFSKLTTFTATPTLNVTQLKKVAYPECAPNSKITYPECDSDGIITYPEYDPKFLQITSSRNRTNGIKNFFKFFFFAS